MTSDTISKAAWRRRARAPYAKGLGTAMSGLENDDVFKPSYRYVYTLNIRSISQLGQRWAAGTRRLIRPGLRQDVYFLPFIFFGYKDLAGITMYAVPYDRV